MAVGGAPHCRSGAAGLHDVIVCVTTNMAFMNDKEVECLINLYQSERSLSDSNIHLYSPQRQQVKTQLKKQLQSHMTNVII